MLSIRHPLLPGLLITGIGDTREMFNISCSYMFKGALLLAAISEIYSDVSFDRWGIESMPSRSFMETLEMSSGL